MFQTFSVLLFLINVVECVTVFEPHTDKLSKSNYTDYLNHEDGVKVIYFFKKELPRLAQFFKDIEKSAIIMEMYDAKFALVNCNEDSLSYCEETDSQEKVYMFRRGNLVLDATLDSMFDVDSIVSNVLQVVLFEKAPIVQSASELKMMEASARGVMDMIIGYEYALGTYEHRILMEIVHVFHERFRFAVVNDQSAIKHLPGYSEEDKSAVWYVQCKDISTISMQSCPAHKYRGKMIRSSLANFFHMLQLSYIHSISEDGHYNPYVDNGLDSVYIFHNTQTEADVKKFTQELNSAYLGLFGIVLVNLDKTDGSSHGYMEHYNIPAIALRKAGEPDLVYMSPGETAVDFLTSQLDLYKAMINSESVIARATEGESVQCTGSDCWTTMLDHLAADLSASYDEMEREDDSISNTSYNLRNVSVSRSHLPELNDQMFYSKIRDLPLLYVLFYLPIEGKSDVSLRVFVKAAEALSTLGLNAVAALNCYDWTYVCSAVNVTSFPVIRIYQRSLESWTSYTNLLTAEQLVNSIILHSADSPLILTTDGEVKRFLEGLDALRTDSVTGVSVLGDFYPDHQPYIRTFASAAERLQGQFLFGLIVNEQTADARCKTHGTQAPCIIIRKRLDGSQPWVSVAMQQVFSVDSLVQYVQQNSKATIPELTAQNFVEHLARQQIFVVAFTSLSDGSLVKVLHSARQQLSHIPTVKDSCFVWMNTSAADGTGMTILKHHVAEPRTEELVVINREKGSIHHYKSGVMDAQEVASWLQESLTGKLSANGVLGPIDPTPRYSGYDFIRQMELDSKLPESDESVYNQDQHHVDALGEDADLMARHSRGEFDRMALSRDMRGLLAEASVQDVSSEAEEELEALLHSRLYRRPLHKMTMSDVSEGETPSGHSNTQHTEL